MDEKEFLISEMKRFYEEKGFNPEISDFLFYNDYPSPMRYRDEFGSWTEALYQSGLKIPNKNHLSTEYLIEKLNECKSKHGKSYFTMKEFDNFEDCPKSHIYIARFGSWRNVMRKISN